MPTLYRAQRVTGVSVDIDPASGMIVPAAGLPAARPTPCAPTRRPHDFADSCPQRRAAGHVHAGRSTLSPAARCATTLDKLVSSFAAETGTPSPPALPFLQALQQGPARQVRAGRRTACRRVGRDRPGADQADARRDAVASPSPTATRPRAGGVSFADVLASILGPQRAGDAGAVRHALRPGGAPARRAGAGGHRLPGRTGRAERRSRRAATT